LWFIPLRKYGSKYINDQIHVLRVRVSQASFNLG
jgi:hypothetical protein